MPSVFGKCEGLWLFLQAAGSKLRWLLMSCNAEVFVAALTFFSEQFALLCTKEYLLLPYLWASKMLENGDGCRLERISHPYQVPCRAMGGCMEGRGKSVWGSRPRSTVVIGEMSSGCVLLPEISPLGYAPHGLGQHDLKRGYAASPQCSLPLRQLSLSADRQWFRKAYFPFLTAF